MRWTTKIGVSGDGTKHRACRFSGFAPSSVLSIGLMTALLGLAADTTRAQERPGSVLVECSALSPLLDDIHTCLDDYLAVMDQRLADIGDLVDRTLDAEARTAFALSRRAFATYRRDNCLWYLAFSTPRTEAEQIAKNCLATMSLERLTELQGLLVENGRDAPKSGYYVYGAERNSFRPCGSEARYWVEGDAAVVGELQQGYLEIASDELQVLFARLDGTLDETLSAPDGHAGVLRTSALTELRVPRESDCRLSAGTTPVAVEPLAEAVPEPIDAAPPVDAAPEPVSPAEPEQQLTAYFGAWLADCTESGGNRGCLLSTALENDGAAPSGTADGDARPAIGLTRLEGGRTRVELVFPGREVDSPAKLRWGIDDAVLGDIVGSSIRVDQTATRQILDAGAYVEDELLPRLIAGGELVVEVLESIDDERGERYRATLVGLTRALAFADDFVRDGGGL